MTSGAIEAMHKIQNQNVEDLKKLSDEDLKKHIRKDLNAVVEMEYPLETWAHRFVPMNADKWIEIAPIKETHDAIANYLAEGGMLSPTAIKWFAERVRNPKLLHRKRERKNTPAYHWQIRYFVELLIKHWGWGVGKSINFVADAAGKTEDHVKEIWED